MTIKTNLLWELEKLSALLHQLVWLLPLNSYYTYIGVITPRLGTKEFDNFLTKKDLNPKIPVTSLKISFTWALILGFNSQYAFRSEVSMVHTLGTEEYGL